MPRAMSFGYAAAGFGVVAAAALALRSTAGDDRMAHPIASAESVNDFLRAIVAGLPHPVIARPQLIRGAAKARGLTAKAQAERKNVCSQDAASSDNVREIEYQFLYFNDARRKSSS